MHNPTATAMEPAAPRIVSLLPAATEIVAALGLDHALVGRSHECDEPAGVATRPALTAPRIDPAGSSRQIHDEVGRTLADAAGPARLYALDGDNLARLAPDLIITQATCAVCAVAADDVRAALAGSGTHARVLELSPTRLADLYADILAVGMATGALARARELVARLKARVMSVRYRVRPTTPVRVAVVEWLDPPMAAGNWVPELVDLAGGIDPLGEAGRHSHWITWDDVIAADPDAVVLIPCGFTIDRVVAEAGRAAIRNRLEMLRAWREGRVYAVDGHHLFNRPGPRLVDSLEVLAELLHPGMFSFAATRRFTKKL